MGRLSVYLKDIHEIAPRRPALAAGVPSTLRSGVTLLDAVRQGGCGLAALRLARPAASPAYAWARSWACA